jgi:hypothetical protein
MQMLGNEPAQDRAADRRYNEDGRRIGLVTRTIAGGGNIPDDGLHQWHQAPATEALKRAGKD